VTRKKPKRAYLLNFSHPVPEEVAKHYRVITIPVQLSPEELANPTKLQAWAHELIQDLPDHADKPGQLRQALQVGRFAVVLPGLSQAAAALLAGLHGVSGHFPRVFAFYRAGDGFELWARPLDLQLTRDYTRQLRDTAAAIAAKRRESR